MNKHSMGNEYFVEKNQSLFANIFFFLVTVTLISHFFVTKAVAFTSICFGVVTGFSILYFVLNNFKINKVAIIPVVSILGMLGCFIFNTLLINGFAGLGAALLTNKYYMAVALSFLIGPKLENTQIKYIFIIFCLGYFIIAMMGVFNYYSYDFGYVSCSYCPRIGVVDPNYIPFRVYHCSLVLYLTEAIVISSIFYNTNEAASKWRKTIVIIFISVSIILIHLIGARIGFLILYALFFYVIILNIRSRFIPLNYIVALLFVIPLLICSLYFSVNSFRARVQDTINDYNSINYEVPAFWVTNFNYRVAGIKLAFDQFPEHKYLGIGYINESNSYHEAICMRYGFENNFDVMPHNQFIKSLIILGIPLFSLCMFFFFLPLLRFKNKFFIAFFIVNIMGAMTDTPFEVKHWLYSYSIILPLFWIYLKNREYTNEINEGKNMY